MNMIAMKKIIEPEDHKIKIFGTRKSVKTSNNGKINMPH
jgi:hypothetical protein